MSFARDIENRLRKSRGISESNIEDEIPFWEFLDIEYEREKKKFYFEAYYIQKPAFSELFKRFIESPVLHKIDDELSKNRPSESIRQNGNPDLNLNSKLVPIMFCTFLSILKANLST